MYISSLSDAELCLFVEHDILKTEKCNVFRGDGYAIDLMADLFAGDHSRDDKHYIYEIRKVYRTNSYIDVKGYSARVQCPGRYRKGKSDVSNGNFIYRFYDTKVDKMGNVLWNGSETKNFVKFVLEKLDDEKKEEYKNSYLQAVKCEAESLMND